MVRKKKLVSRLVVASLSLSVAISVYCFARVYPPEVLAPFQALNADLASYTGIFGSAPSFFYTLALGLIVGIFASSRSSARFHCLMWTALCLLLEISQHAVPSAWIATHIPEALTRSSWNLFGPYWTRGVFDPVDLLATLFGCLVAMALVTLLHEENYAHS